MAVLSRYGGICHRWVINVAYAETMGIRKDHAVEYLADSQGMQVSFQAMSESLESVRDCGMLDTRCMQSVREDTRTRSRVHRRNRHS